MMCTVLLLTGCSSNAPKETANEPETIKTEQAVIVGNAEKSTAETVAAADIKPDTHSAYNTSFLATVGDDVEVAYLYKPKKLTSVCLPEDIWTVSDESVATVRDGVVSGRKEGMVEVSQIRDGKKIAEWKIAVTTFNDGRRAESSYELGPEGIAALFEGAGGVPTAQYLKMNINTIQDAVNYLKYSDFEYRSEGCYSATVYSEWLWRWPAETMILINAGHPFNLCDILIYFLGEDFERCGIIETYGQYGYNAVWFYEDGVYYLIDPYDIAAEIKSNSGRSRYVPFMTTDTAGLFNEFSQNIDLSKTIAVIMVESPDFDRPYTVYRNYQHDSSKIYNMHVVIGFEDVVLEHMNILFENHLFDYEIIGYPADEIPDAQPKINGEVYYNYK